MQQSTDIFRFSFLNSVDRLTLKLTGLFTFVLEHIMSIIGDATKDDIGVFGVPFVDFLGLHVKPVLIIPENVMKNGRLTR